MHYLIPNSYIIKAVYNNYGGIKNSWTVGTYAIEKPPVASEWETSKFKRVKDNKFRN